MLAGKYLGVEVHLGQYQTSMIELSQEKSYLFIIIIFTKKLHHGHPTRS